MAKGRVFRVVVGDKGYDLMGAFARASAADWAALAGATGRNPFTLAQRIGEMEALYKAPESEQADRLAGAVGSRLIETVTDLLFLARRREGDREPGTDRPVTYETSEAATPIMEVLAGFAGSMMRQAAAENAEGEPDPT